MSSSPEDKPNISNEKWDNPARNDCFGREPFVDTIVKTIQSNPKGFNLGISARWGEGKSSILEQLQPKLEHLNYLVLKFQPWKYTQDQISIKRKFINNIFRELKKDERYKHVDLYSDKEEEKELPLEEYDKLFSSKLSLFLKYGFVSCFIFLLVLLILKYLCFMNINIIQVFFTNLFIPALAGLIPIIQKITEVRIKHVTPKIDSAEQFEDLFNEAISEIKKSEKAPERIIIFVDDLDRCNHVEVEQILTALFTFFYNDHCTYIITADHTVIRRYISDFLKLEDELDEKGNPNYKGTQATKQKEATEYLKKIFQINFIVPTISIDLLKIWLEKLVDENAIIKFNNLNGRSHLINLILTNFDSNPRKIKHFIRTLAFQLEAINEKIKASKSNSSEEVKNLSKVLKSPELLGKILIIQDRFPDFYDKLIKEPKLIQKYESGETSEDHELQNIFSLEPKFYNSTTRVNDQTIDPYSFLYFSGSTGYADTKLIDIAEVNAFAKTANFESLLKILPGLTDEPRISLISHIQKELDVLPAKSPEKINTFRSLLYVIGFIEEPKSRLAKLKEIFDSTGYSVELGALQIIDIENIFPIIDADIATKLINETPFTSGNMPGEILKAFIATQEKLDDDIADKFIQVITNKIKLNDEQLSSYLSMVKQLGSRIRKSIALQKVLIEMLSLVADNQKQEIFLLINQDRKDFDLTLLKEFESVILKNIASEKIVDVLWVLNNIPGNINDSNFDIKGLVEAVGQRVKKSTKEELEKIMTTLFTSQIMKFFEKDKFDYLLNSFIEELNTEDIDKQGFIKSKMEDIISFSDNKLGTLRKIMLFAFPPSDSENAEIFKTIDLLMKFYSSDPKLRQELYKELKNLSRKYKDNVEVKDYIKKIIDPIPPKKDEAERPKKK